MTLSYTYISILCPMSCSLHEPHDARGVPVASRPRTRLLTACPTAHREVTLPWSPNRTHLLSCRVCATRDKHVLYCSTRYWILQHVVNLNGKCTTQNLKNSPLGACVHAIDGRRTAGAGAWRRDLTERPPGSATTLSTFLPFHILKTHPKSYQKRKSRFHV